MTLICYRDNIPSIQVKSWPLAASLWNSDCISGLVPTLFADNVEAASEALTNNPGKAHGDMAKFNKVILMPEDLSLSDAAAFLKKPR